MKTLVTLSTAITLFIGSSFINTATAGITQVREARSAKIEALYEAVRSGRLNRSDSIQARLDIARLKAEARKERRQQDRRRDKAAAQY